MSPSALQFTQALDTVAGLSATRSKLVSVSIAIALANTLPLPSSPVNVPMEHWNGQLFNIVRVHVGKLGEELIMNSPVVMELVRSFWLLRYRAAFQSQWVIANPNLSFFENLLGVSSYVSDDNREFIEANKLAIYFLLPLAIELVTPDKSSK